MNSRFKYLRSRGNVTNRPWPGSVKKEGGGGGGGAVMRATSLH